PDEVGADANGDWEHKLRHRRPHEHEHRHEHEDEYDGREEEEHEHRRGGERRAGLTGKIADLLYDRYGAFVGFRLDTEDGLRRFEGRERELEQLARRAWQERTTVTVYAERHDPDRPLGLVLHSASAALE